MESDTAKVLDQIVAWRNDLISMSRRNRLLYFSHTKSSSIEIAQPDSAAIYGLVENGRRRCLDFYDPKKPTLFDDPVDDPEAPATNPRPDEAVALVRGEGSTLVRATPARLRSVLRTLRRAASQEFLDKGLQSLYLGFGMLQWVDSRDESQPCFAPILLVPVELRSEETNRPDRLYRLLEEDAVINPALALKLESDFAVTLPAIEDYEELELARFLSDVTDCVSEFSDWQVQDRVVLGRFAFHKDVMYRDLLENCEAIADHPFVRALVEGVEQRFDYSFDEPLDDHLDDTIPPEDMRSIRDADSSQRKCIWAASEGKSFVMDGPPGTGKSQTIANMIAELMATGKSVLFVSEKAAALEVVYKRLKEAGLHDYVLQLHSHKTTRKEVAQELGRALEQRPKLRGGFPASQLEALKKHRQELNDYATALNEVREPFGRSLHQVIGRLAQLGDAPTLNVEFGVEETFSEFQLEAILGSARRLSRAWGPVERAGDFLWRDLMDRGVNALEKKDLRTWLGLLHGLLLDLQAASQETTGLLLLPPASSVANTRAVRTLVHLLQDRRDIPQAWLSMDSRNEVSRVLGEVAAQQKDHACALEAVRSAFGGQVSIGGLHGLSVNLERSLTELGSLHLLFSVPLATKLDEFLALRSSLDGMLEHVGESLPVEVEQVCRRFDVEERPSIGLTVDLLQLLAIGDTVDRPLGEWLDSTGLASLRGTRSSLGEIIESYRQTYARVTELFSDEILQLPVADLALRFKNAHTGLGRLKSAYRRDKKLLQPACRLGKVTPEAVALLDDAAQLKKLSGRLKLLEVQYAAQFGVYYAGLETDLARVDRAIHSAETMLDAVSRRLSLAGALRHLAWGAEMDAATRVELQTLRERLDMLGSFAQTVLGVDGVRVDDLDLAETVGALAEGARVLADISETARLVKENNGQVVCLEGLKEGLASADAVYAAVKATEQQAAIHRGLLGDRYAGLETDVQALEDDLVWTEETVFAAGGPVEPIAASALLGVDVSPEGLDGLTACWEEAVDTTRLVFTASRAEAVIGALEGEFVDANDLIVRFLETTDDIDEWYAFVDARDEFVHLEQESLAAQCIVSGLDRKDVEPAVERHVLETWVDSTIEKDSQRLGSLRSVERDSVVAEYCELDKEYVRLTAGLVMEACNARRPGTALGTAAIVQREAQKRKRHMPIRTLLKQTRELAVAVKPCFMMSPLSVSQFLAPEFNFDVVIFDEASQIRPHDAVNCIYRGRQHIIAGDRHQLPPTSFFDVHSDDGDEWQEDQLEQYESILDKVKGCGAVPSMSLRWHYRSRHEDLITFSNYSFYSQNPLITFPSPKDPVPPLGLGFNLVDGVYRRGGQRDNLIEAREVARTVARYARDYPSLSIGVVAFSQNQETAIQDAIDELRATDPSLPVGIFSSDRLDGFFVKNLETVQGDERDVIVLSVGYGPDENGKLTMNFGPINKDGGYRRLNVAITRARMRVEVVASIRARDLDGESENEGVRHLKRYLDYAENGPSTLAFDATGSLGDVESPFEEEVARVVRSWGYDVAPQVGCAGYRVDLGIRGADGFGGFALGIECDGAAYHSARSARDRDRLRQGVLEGLGWRLYRIWGPSWYRQRATEEARLQKAIERAMREPRGPSLVVPPPDRPIVIVDEIELAPGIADADWLVEYKVAEPALSRLDQSVPLGEPSAQPILWRVIPEILRIEQPVHIGILLVRIRDVWGNGRVGSRIQANYEMALGRLKARKEIEVDGAGFASLVDTESAMDRGLVRKPTEDRRSQRTAQQVPREEVAQAVRLCWVAVPGITRNELSIQVAKVFGWSRRGCEIASVIDDVIDEMKGELGWRDDEA